MSRVVWSAMIGSPPVPSESVPGRRNRTPCLVDRSERATDRPARGARLGAERDDLADPHALLEVREGFADLLERAAPRDHALEVEEPGTPQLEQPRELAMRVRGAQVTALQLLL